MHLEGRDLERAQLIEQHLRCLFAPGDIIEIRGWPDPLTGFTGVTAGIFNCMARASHCAVHMGNAGLQTYHSLNPIKRDSYYGRHMPINRLRKKVWFAAADNQIACRRNYLFDFDADRPAESKKHCATKEEKGAAWLQAQECREYLASLRWPEPIVVDSGNGFHLLYREWGCAVGPETTKDLLSCLRFLKTRFPFLDASVYNPGRIVRVPWTVNRKGFSTEERPHRFAKVLEYPVGGFKVIGPGQIHHLAVQDCKTDEDGRPLRRTTQNKGESNLVIDEDGVRDLIDEYPGILELAGEGYKGEAVYFALEECPFKGAAHHDQEVGMGHTCIILGPDKIGFRCFGSDCSSHTFGDLLKLLHRQTGRWPDTQIWEDDQEALDARWDCGVANLWSKPAEFEPDISHYSQDKTETEFQKYVKIVHQEFEPGEEAQRLFRKRMSKIWDAEDYDAMLEFLDYFPTAYHGEPA
jgi:hypothetical protein